MLHRGETSEKNCILKLTQLIDHAVRVTDISFSKHFSSTVHRENFYGKWPQVFHTCPEQGASYCPSLWRPWNWNKLYIFPPVRLKTATKTAFDAAFVNFIVSARVSARSTKRSIREKWSLAHGMTGRFFGKAESRLLNSVFAKTTPLWMPVYVYYATSNVTPPSFVSF